MLRDGREAGGAAKEGRLSASVFAPDLHKEVVILPVINLKAGSNSGTPKNKKSAAEIRRAPEVRKNINAARGRDRGRPNHGRCATYDRLHSTNDGHAPSTIRGLPSALRAAFGPGGYPSRASQRQRARHGRCGRLSSGSPPPQHVSAARQAARTNLQLWPQRAEFFSKAKISFCAPSPSDPPIHKIATLALKRFQLSEEGHSQPSGRGLKGVEDKAVEHGKSNLA
jgi:hypothetical protein